ncbi:hypothetical protein AX17_002459 [Amanita inopinata Kibby_2008]|nr:hypothetical protein AX17_002459 [Amanita inopinata Kibby_2008]
MSLPETLATAHKDGEPLIANGHDDHDEKPVNGHVELDQAAEGNVEEDDDDESGEDTEGGEENGVGKPASHNAEEEEQEDVEGEEEEEEPSLKYEPIVGAIPQLLKKDAASSLAIVNRTMALGTHGGIVHVLDLSGKRLKSYKRHTASIVDICLDATGDFVATASIDGQVTILSLSTPEYHIVDMKRPLRTVALEPNFAKRSSRAYVCGGLAGDLIMREKGWLGHKDTLLHTGEGPIWQVRWRGKFIAWANDVGVRIYDINSQTRFSFIDRPAGSPRADLFKCSLYWQDDSTLLIAWADSIKVARIRARTRTSPSNSTNANLPPYIVEIAAFFKLDCMLSGIAAHPLQSHNNNNAPPFSLPTSPTLQPSPTTTITSSIRGERSGSIGQVGHVKYASTSSILSQSSSIKTHSSHALTSFLILAYTPPETFEDEMTDDRAKQARKVAERPELRIISRAGEELSADPLDVMNYRAWGCNDYMLIDADSGGRGQMPGDVEGRCYVVMSPQGLMLVRPRDRRDHVAWLVEKKRYEEALEAAEALEQESEIGVANGVASKSGAGMTLNGKCDDQKEKEVELCRAEEGIVDPLSSSEIGQKFIGYLTSQGEFEKAARLCPKVCGYNQKRWEDWIFTFAQTRQLQIIIPYVPFESPTLDKAVYEMILAYFLANDHQALFNTIKEWPRDIYDISAVIVAVRAELDKLSYTSNTLSPQSGSAIMLMECIAELYTINRQPGKALPYFLRLQRPNVFDLIREHNLFTDVRDQVLLLVEFDHELMKRRREAGVKVDESKSEAITLLVNNIHSIPIARVVQQLQKSPYYLFLYLDALVSQDAHLVCDFADLQVKLYAEYATPRLIDFLRASNYYSLEQAFNVCRDRDLVPEMVFLLGRMGNNKQALTLIIERLGDVYRAIEFAKEQNDDDLWEDLLRYSETRPTFIRGLLENVGVEISPIRLIRRIKNGLEIPGLKDALIKILQDFHLQISLLEGCQSILNGDNSDLSRTLQKGQTSGFIFSAKTICPVCSRSIQEPPQSLVILYLCRHVVHSDCLGENDPLPSPPDRTVHGAGLLNAGRGISGKIAYESIIRAKVGRGCPVCYNKGEGART